MLPKRSHRPFKTFTIFVIFVKSWFYRAYESNIFSNWQITSFWVVAELYKSTDQNGAVLEHLFAARYALTGWWYRSIKLKQISQSDCYVFTLRLLSFCFVSRPALNFTVRLAGTWIRSRVFGFCAVLGAQSRGSKTPKSRNSKRLPLASSEMISSRKF